MTSKTAANWLNGKLSDTYGVQYLCAQMGMWNCMRCGHEAPFSWWRSFTQAAIEESKELA